MSVVMVDPGVCPDCGTPLRVRSVRQAALFRHGGYGGTALTAIRSCPVCGWELEHHRGETAPDKTEDPKTTMPLDLGWWRLKDGRQALLCWWPGPGTLVLQGPTGPDTLAVIATEDDVRRRLDGWQDHADTPGAMGWLAGRLEGVR